MEKHRFALSFLALVLAASSALSCGANQGQLRSITISPATADAQNYPDGQVPFVATGVYIDPSRTVTPQPIAAWAACQQNAPTTDVSITTKGVAQCASGATGTYLITASAPGTCTCLAPCPSSDAVGTAQLTCP
jgi:hypothetical protein